MISSYVKDKHTDWDRNIQNFALARRTMANKVTGITPAVLNLGRVIALPFDRALQEGNNGDTPVALAAALPEKLHEITVYVRQCMGKAGAKQKVYFDQYRRDVRFNVGDKVLVRNHALSDAEAEKSKNSLISG